MKNIFLGSLVFVFALMAVSGIVFAVDALTSLTSSPADSYIWANTTYFINFTRASNHNVSVIQIKVPVLWDISAAYISNGTNGTTSFITANNGSSLMINASITARASGQIN